MHLFQLDARLGQDGLRQTAILLKQRHQKMLHIELLLASLRRQ